MSTPVAVQLDDVRLHLEVYGAQEAMELLPYVRVVHAGVELNRDIAVPLGEGAAATSSAEAGDTGDDDAPAEDAADATATNDADATADTAAAPPARSPSPVRPGDASQQGLCRRTFGVRQLTSFLFADCALEKLTLEVCLTPMPPARDEETVGSVSLGAVTATPSGCEAEVRSAEGRVCGSVEFGYRALAASPGSKVGGTRPVPGFQRANAGGAGC